MQKIAHLILRNWLKTSHSIYSWKLQLKSAKLDLRIAGLLATLIETPVEQPAMLIVKPVAQLAMLTVMLALLISMLPDLRLEWPECSLAVHFGAEGAAEVV